jgi:hypothetical protein
LLEVGSGLQLPGVVDVSHVPEQHWPSAAHAPPSTAQAWPEHVPPTHDSEQHSVASVQVSPAAWQNAAVVHAPVAAPGAIAHAAEQHSSREEQGASPGLHVVRAAATQRSEVASQAPEQHCASWAQVPSRTTHTSTAAVHRPLLHDPLQQSDGTLHAAPVAAQAEASRHVASGQAPEQQSAGDAQVLPSARHAPPPPGPCVVTGAAGLDLLHAAAAVTSTASGRAMASARRMGFSARGPGEDRSNRALIRRVECGDDVGQARRRVSAASARR